MSPAGRASFRTTGNRRVTREVGECGECGEVGACGECGECGALQSKNRLKSFSASPIRGPSILATENLTSFFFTIFFRVFW